MKNIQKAFSEQTDKVYDFIANHVKDTMDEKLYYSVMTFDLSLASERKMQSFKLLMNNLSYTEEEI